VGRTDRFVALFAGIAVMVGALDAIADDKATARLDALRSSLSVIAVIARMAVFWGAGIPAEQTALQH
jgi:hypothetical protein